MRPLPMAFENTRRAGSLLRPANSRIAVSVPFAIDINAFEKDLRVLRDGTAVTGVDK